MAKFHQTHKVDHAPALKLFESTEPSFASSDTPYRQRLTAQLAVGGLQLRGAGDDGHAVRAVIAGEIGHSWGRC